MSDEREERMSSVLGATALVLGNIQGQGDLEIRGRVQGDVVVDGRVLVAAGALVLGAIEAGQISISGTVRGNLLAADGVEISGSGQVEGNVAAPRIGIEAGARVRGNLRTGDDLPRTPRVGADETRAADEPLLDARPSETAEFDTDDEASDSTLEPPRRKRKRRRGGAGRTGTLTPEPLLAAPPVAAPLLPNPVARVAAGRPAGQPTLPTFSKGSRGHLRS